MTMSPVAEIGDQVGGPAEAAVLEPGGHEAVAAMLGEHALDRGLVGLGGRRA